jgi:hypothetical protein
VCKEEDVLSIAAEIMTYLQQRPMASDSLDGITHWWLVQQAIVKNRKLVEQALEQLTREGKVVERKGSTSEAIYSLSPTHKGDEI